MKKIKKEWEPKAGVRSRPLALWKEIFTETNVAEEKQEDFKEGAIEDEMQET